ncbi:double-strand break repair helicase AddA [Acetobacter cibinongensis]|uniref:DNA 3'-5' helicase n=1 Tax=Acetobacter cibinongensis TaxID=146475 RepID=A0A0D6N5L2_9PROT|nr:double-strand break repair helicase AddA [Acetobacter cibinongensis]GAN60858.1 DNA helicase II UvrD/Rep [Acetobacter cibinongensis]GBQ13421.1 DNA helicase II [Acetobacter cibinongensis NRIC 0482]GEL58644.1 double-strand break repair helicase AddA [Acetobacter cibinongensis]
MTAVQSSSDAIAQANTQQGLASDPTASVFVSASAGSGKTKLLIDRLLRLMLPRRLENGEITPGSHPARILCLTFTKAAAAEMAIRLQKRLGEWVTLSDPHLDRELQSLFVPCTPETRRRARALFADVLDLPGGMRIGTIHAFCQSLLRRFPLEAAMNPHFTVMEETDASLALLGCVETVLGERDASTLAPLAGQIGLGDFVSLAGTLRHKPQAERILDWALKQPQDIPVIVSRVLGLSANTLKGSDLEQKQAACTDFAGEDALRTFLGILADEGTDTVKRNVVLLLDWLALPPAQRAENWAVWRNGLLTKEGKPRSRGLITTKLSAKYATQAEYLVQEAERILGVEETLRARGLARLGVALLQNAAPVAALYATRKTQRGLVEYDDLIRRTLGLLREPGAAWVMYKLDGGIDHLLLDEVQDTSAEQWRIAGDLTEEFFAGEGTRTLEESPRTVFAVGDYKQSIYGFQGADPQSFRTWRRVFQNRALAAGLRWREPELTVSFRSTTPVLRLVDAVFSVPDAAQGVAEEDGRAMQHQSARPGQGGRVELWPLADSGAEEDDPASPWAPAVANTTRQNPRQKLADTLARHIARELAAPPQPGQKALTPGDVLILVPRRSPFVTALIRALKTQNVPVATLVRTGLADQLAVQDLMALCSALLLPQDDLTLACVLTSPLGGMSDDSLMVLATGRNPAAPLWSALRERHKERPDWQKAWALLDSLFHRVDYLTPHELLSEALGRAGGRARLLARLGPEAAESIDELLSAALRYQEQHPPSLQGFVHWLRNSEESVKREAEAGGDSVRVMTAHGAKGLQARLVILPDTVSKPRYEDRLFWTKDKHTGLDVPLYVPRGALATGLTHTLRAQTQASAVEEYNRLLYVALTRAAERLIVCGWMPGRHIPPESWYERCRQGFEAAGAQAQEWQEGDWCGEALVLEEHPVPPQAPASHDAGEVEKVSPKPPALPGWMGQAPDWHPTPLPVEPPLALPLAPSRPDDAMLGPLPPVRSPLDVASITPAAAREAAFRRGNLVHALLQYLPAQPTAHWSRLAQEWLARPASGLTADDAAHLAKQVLGVLVLPDLAPLFAPEARPEQKLAGIAAGQVIVGQVDRMRVLPDRVLVCDFKSGRHMPRTSAGTPVLYLRQMAAYRALLQGLYPDRPVVCVLVWTEGPRADVLPDAVLDAHAPTHPPS